jgi:hypothetical protein
VLLILFRLSWPDEWKGAPVESPKVSGRGAQRRSIGIAVLVVAAGVLAFQATQFSWFSGAFLSGESWTWVSLSPSALSTVGTVPGPTGPVPALYTVFGMQAPGAWVLVAVALGLIATLTRLGVLSLLGVGAAWMARSAAVSLEPILSSAGDVPGRFVLDGSGYAQFIDWTWVLLGLLVVSAAQITYAGHVRRRAAVAAGEDVDANLLDLFHSVQTSAVSRLQSAGQDAGKSSKSDGASVKSGA